MITENFISCCAYLGLVLVASLVPLVWGAIKKRRGVKPVNYFPPKGASPMDVLLHYYGKNANARNIFNPLMLYWASRGFITVEEDCKRGLKLTKIKDIEPPEYGKGFDRETYELEVKLFCHIFKGNKVFYTLGASEKFADFYDNIMIDFDKKVKAATTTKTRTLSIVFMILPMLVLIVESVIIGTTLGSDSGVMVAMIFPIVGLIFMRFARLGIPKGMSVRFLLYPFFACWSGIPTALIISMIPTNAAIIVLLGILIAFLDIYLITPKYDIRTDEQLKAYSEICGFKQFLLAARADELELMVEENPNYYFDILPYCYVLKITEKLKPKFDKIVMDGPSWYLGELRDTLMF